jgi:hypothetical protein
MRSSGTITTKAICTSEGNGEGSIIKVKGMAMLMGVGRDEVFEFDAVVNIFIRFPESRSWYTWGAASFTRTHD